LHVFNFPCRPPRPLSASASHDRLHQSFRSPRVISSSLNISNKKYLTTTIKAGKIS
jgi:hypothetical protein